MAATVKFHTVDGSALELAAPGQKRWTVNAVIDGLQVDTDPDPYTIWRAIEAVEAYGWELNQPIPVSSHTDLIVSRMLARGLANNQCWLQIICELPYFGGPASALIIRNRSFVTSVSANTINGAAGRLKLTVDPITLDDTGEPIEGDIGTISYLKPMRAFQVSGLTYGAPAGGGDDYVGYSNNANWRGKAPGFWLMTEYLTDEARYSGYYTFQATALSRNSEAWSEYLMIKNQRSGKIPISITDADLDDLRAIPYFGGSISKIPGVTRVDPYLGANFASVFGVP